MNTENNMQAPWSERLRNSKALIPTMAVLAVTTLALAATLVGQRSDALSRGEQPQAVVQSPQALALQAPAKEAAVKPVAAPIEQRSDRPVAVTPPKAVSCTHCGTVESVTTVQRQGAVNGIGNSGIGVGAIGGAVVGGLLGHQVGGGNGKKAATVLGAVGGGYAGHAIEKNSNSYTAYQMHVRMSDGTMRVIEQRSAVAAGSQVTVQGNSMRVLPPASAQSLRHTDSGGVRG